MSKLNKGIASKKGQPKKAKLTDHDVRKRPGATAEQMRCALRGVFVGGGDGKTWGANEAARRAEGVTRSPLIRANVIMSEAMHKLGEG